MMTFFSFDFLSLECYFGQSNHLQNSLIYSAVPIAIAVVLCLIHSARRTITGGSVATSSITNQLLLLGYLVVPPVSLKLLQALDCVAIAKKTYLRIDTSVDCESEEYRTFRLYDGCLLSFYLAMPLVWLMLLTMNRERLNPIPVTGSDKKHAMYLREADETLTSIRFLFSPYKPAYFFFEVIEM